MTKQCRSTILFLVPAFFVQAGCDRSLEYGETVERGQVIANSIGMKLVLIPPGEFLMGGREPAASSVDNRPQHRVRITKSFYMGVYEVTQDEWERVMSARPSQFCDTGVGKRQVEEVDTGQFPVDRVTWSEAIEFCRRLTVLPAEAAAGRTYRLPTEAEWEYACRASTNTAFYFGDSISLAQVNFNRLPDETGAQRPLQRTAQVGSYPPNAFGIHDMHGNVWEWCGDAKRNYSRRRQTDPAGGVATHYMVRGGAWDFPADLCRSAHRSEALSAYVYFGFRVVCEQE